MKYYEILDVSLDATAEQIKAAYRILVQLHHPDRLQQANDNVRHYAEEKLKRINEAYTVLSDPARRAQYDATLRTRKAEYKYEAPAETWDSSPRRKSQRRHTSAEQAAYEAAYEEWAHQQADRYAEQREAERQQRAQQAAERERREAEEQARRAAAEHFPRARTQGNELTLQFSPGVWTTLVLIPEGDFLMGSAPDQDALALVSEQPQHGIYLSEFYIGKYPITNAQYQAYLDATRPKLSAPAWQMPPGKETHPVVNVTWDDAVAFCQWLTRETGRAFRLPTEAEWEKAARGVESLLYPWGNEWDPGCLNSQGTLGSTTPVGQFSPVGDSPFGMADMSGNVWEWCADWYSEREYARRARTLTRGNPQGPADGEGYVVRGGAFDSSPKQARAAHRNWYYPFNRRMNVGFRLVAGPVVAGRASRES